MSCVNSLGMIISDRQSWVHHGGGSVVKNASRSRSWR